MRRFRKAYYLLSRACLSHNNVTSNFIFLKPSNVNTVRFLPFCSKNIPSEIKKDVTVLEIDDNIVLPDHSPNFEQPFNFAMYADKSSLVQKYIDLGVNLYEIEKRPHQAQFLANLSIEKITPYLLFLTNNGVSSDKIGKIITKHPFLLKEDLDDLEVRVNYLMSKKFDKEMISTIIVRNPKWLSTPVKVIDERLGYIQSTFKLRGDDIRNMVVQAPGIALLDKYRIVTNTYALKEEMGLTINDLKQILVKEPRLLRLDPYDLVSTFHYLTKTMNVSLSLILEQPKALTYRKFFLKERHMFLKSLGRAQYCNFLPGYVSLNSLVESNDSEFCTKIAKSSEKLFYDFLKTF